MWSPNAIATTPSAGHTAGLGGDSPPGGHICETVAYQSHLQSTPATIHPAGPIKPTQEPALEPLERGLPRSLDPVFGDPKGNLASMLRI